MQARHGLAMPGANRMEPFYAWQARHETNSASRPKLSIMDTVVIREKPHGDARYVKRFKQLTLVDAICAAILSEPGHLAIPTWRAPER